jgi:filamentous hemagglutinin family protein
MTNGAVFRPGITALIMLFTHPLFGGVVMYRSVGGGPSVPLPGPNFIIPANFGRQKGGNLFESFSQFNLNSSQTATFTRPTTGPTVHNILARVTSGSLSSIDGTIRSDIPGANLFFMNPAGVLFGEHAQLDVSGSVAVTTANYLDFGGGGRFNADLGGGDVLTSAKVSSFGFLEAPARVSFVGPRPPGSPFLNIAPGKSFSVVAGDIKMNAYGILGYGSRVNLVSVKSAGEAKLDATDFKSAVDVSQFTAMGTIDITNSSRINTNLSSPKRVELGVELGGPVFIRGGTFLLDDQSLISSRSFDGSLNKDGSVNSLNQVSNIDVEANNVKILRGARISAPTSGSADAGHIRIIADSLLLIDARDTGLTTGLLALSDKKSSTGKGGEVRVTAGDVEILNGGEISAYTAGRGDGGMVEVKADSLLIKGTGLIGPGFSAGIFADARIGNGGDIIVKAGDVEITGGGEISTDSFGEGSGGSITMTATHSLVINGTGSEEGLITPPKDKPNPVSGETSVFHGTSILALSYGGGNGGNITLNAPLLSVVGGGQIAAASFGTGNGGTVNVTADSLLINEKGALENVLFGTGIFADARGRSGDGGPISVTASDVEIKGGEISTSTSGTGHGGIVNVQAADATITAGGQIAASTFGSGKGGRVEVTAKNSLLIHGSDSGIFAVAGFAGLLTSGAGGDMVVSASDLSLQNGGAISAASFTSGDAGSVDLSRVGTLSMDSGSSISSANTGTGDAGEVKINTTGAVILKHGSIVSTASVLGDAGDITLNSGGEIKLKDQSSITGSAGGSGGNILITTPDLLYLLDSEISAVAVGGGGNFEIDSQIIVLNNSTIKTNAPRGQGGNQNLNSDFFFRSDSTIFATGTINITAPALDLGAQLITLPNSLLSAANQLQERCTTLLQGDFSSFISIGRGGTEPAPEELQEEF